MQASSGVPSASWQPSASGQAPASQAAQAQAAAQDQLNQSQSLKLALRQPRIRPNYSTNHIPPAPIPKVPTPIEHFSPDAHPTDPFRTQHKLYYLDLLFKSIDVTDIELQLSANVTALTEDLEFLVEKLLMYMTLKEYVQQ